MRVYFAAALFTQMERKWNRMLASALEEAMPGLEVILPQDFKPSGKYNDNRQYGALFRMCVNGIDSSDAVVAMIEGAEMDSGTAWEMGYAYARGVPVIGVRTDFRPGAEHGANIMISRCCRYLVREFSFQEDVAVLASDIVRRLKKINAAAKRRIYGNE
ncbi:MAG: nucleoside 2-deoxyribosyltransferase [Planctomycetota bacterium]|jgi:nucleoside 2-deoxyribosyltransferase|nr:nucleoside 2-deoxyribosyltransferase [Planctomycetota bacterium]